MESRFQMNLPSFMFLAKSMRYSMQMPISIEDYDINVLRCSDHFQGRQDRKLWNEQGIRHIRPAAICTRWKARR